jgi:hypothetical protein
MSIKRTRFRPKPDPPVIPVLVNKQVLTRTKEFVSWAGGIGPALALIHEYNHLSTTLNVVHNATPAKSLIKKD